MCMSKIVKPQALAEPRPPRCVHTQQGLRGWDNEGQTALHYAAACEFLDIVELLLQSGADPTLRDQDGCLPEEVTGCKAVSLVLQQHMAGKA
ncbi:Acyl-CoA-binding domain-containing protein 6 [Myotis brandtii]|uniref:Acyl-CoA-binding domain-containing protein 6 n=1 Tax=Myotis brandtii TaxID=109478 RepID=S7NGN1_MYOBR|nr:Acyl-CoA-binding domain-containing protein 6 [Myotis brandtii]